ncbi:cdc25-like protein phosphatase twine [Drosophila bipectinata]|uniref:cdc25-like protein phosphatase twine n=1 Tax=Drosophila bipectinata TaxID=42026 RepID=UPI0038B3609A
MASKRLMLEEEEEEDLCGSENDEQLQENPSAKRHKSGALETLMHRLLKRQIPAAGSGCNTILSPITELSQNMRCTTLEPGGGATPKSTQRSSKTLSHFNSVSSRTLSSFDSVSSSYDSGNSLDDEYMAMFELEAEEDPKLGLPGDLELLISGQLKTYQLPDAEEPSKRSVRRCLSMYPCDQQRQAEGKEEYPSTEHLGHKSPGRKLQRKTLSMNDAEIMTALGDEPELIGDLSRPCALPCLLSGTRHRDLKTISSDTLARLMQGDFAEQLGSKGGYQIIDCRYPYEYLGGHIRGAMNLYTRGQIQDAFPSFAEQLQRTEERRIFVFHCEFSSERGPKLLRFLRSNDRSLHAHNYPTLDYPELYLLHNGYKEFFGLHAELCEPEGYVPMLAPDHNEEFRYFRAKTKSWQCGEGEGGDSGIGGGGGGGGGGGSRTLKKSRSRLVYAE